MHGMGAAAMATIISVVLFVVLPISARGDNNMPFLGNPCDDVNCGRGNCSVDSGKRFGFVCQCQPGWKRVRDLDNEQDFEFLPCIIPNCSVNYSCMPAPPPSPPVPWNESLFDPCYWMYCGEGTCTKNGTHRHTCQCNPGYTNLLDTPEFPCYSDCAVGSDCARLGIRVSNSLSPSPGGGIAGSDSGTNIANSFLPGKFHWIAIFLVSVAMALKY